MGVINFNQNQHQLKFHDIAQKPGSHKLDAWLRAIRGFAHKPGYKSYIKKRKDCNFPALRLFKIDFFVNKRLSKTIKQFKKLFC